MQPLDGIRVVDLGRALAGPYCGMLLGDLGADVIKVEEKGQGDFSRTWAPFWNEESAYFLSVNRNKRSIALDLRDTTDREVLRKLILTADIVVENFRPGVMEKFGLGYEQLRKEHPSLIYCSISGFGRTGPKREVAAMDAMMQAYAGLMSITGEEGGDPVRIGVSLVDLAAGTMAVAGILAALRVRDKTGRGQLVDVSLLDSQISWLSYHLTGYLATGELPKRTGSKHPANAPVEAFRTSDGYIMLGAFSDRLFERTCNVLGATHLLEDERFQTNIGRVRHREELAKELQSIFVHKTTAQWVEALETAGVPCAPVNTVADLVNDPQVIERNGLIAMEHPKIPGLRLPGHPFRLSDTPLKATLPPPLYNQHETEILAEIGYQADLGRRRHGNRGGEAKGLTAPQDPQKHT